MVYLRKVLYLMFSSIAVCLWIVAYMTPDVSYAQAWGTAAGGSAGGASSSAWWASSSPCPKGDIELNTNFPFLGRCISKDLNDPEKTNVANAFPFLVGVLVRVTMTIILVAGVLLIIAGGLMMTSEGIAWTASRGKSLIIKVIIGLAILGTSAIVLNLINPNFFGTSSWW